MNPIRFFNSFSAVTLIFFSALTLISCSEKAEEKEMEIPIPAVPPKVISTAEEVLPGVEINEAEIKRHEDDVVYELEGKVKGKKVEIKIKPDGTVKELKQEED